MSTKSKKTTPAENASLASLAKVVSHYDLQGLRLLSCECREPALTGTGLPSHVKLKTNITTRIDRPKQLIDVDLQFDLGAEYSVSEGADIPANCPIRLSAKFKVIYRFSHETPPSDQEIATFANASAAISTWPYWREFVSSMTSRMGIPTILVPLMNIPQMMKSAADSGQKVKGRAAVQPRKSKSKSVSR